jgi:hypothetical protein
LLAAAVLLLLLLVLRTLLFLLPLRVLAAVLLLLASLVLALLVLLTALLRALLLLAALLLLRAALLVLLVLVWSLSHENLLEKLREDPLGAGLGNQCKNRRAPRMSDDALDAVVAIRRRARSGAAAWSYTRPAGPLAGRPRRRS